MDTRKAGGILSNIGFVLIMIALALWLNSHGHRQESTLHCLYSWSLDCQLTRIPLTGLPLHEPMVFWVAVGMLVVGTVMERSAK